VGINRLIDGKCTSSYLNVIAIKQLDMQLATQLTPAG